MYPELIGSKDFVEAMCYIVQKLAQDMKESLNTYIVAEKVEVIRLPPFALSIQTVLITPVPLLAAR